MRKTVWKLAPYEAFEVESIQGWLDELSQHGLQFRVQYGDICILDRKDAPARYRMDIRRKGDCDRADGARFALYRDMGWEYCNDYYGDDVFRNIDKDAPELHTDSETLLALVRRCCRKRLWCCPLLILVAANLVRTLIHDVERSGSWSALLTDPVYLPGTIVYVTLALALLVNVVLILLRWLRLRRNGYRQMPHSAERARRGSLWAGIQLALTSFYLLYVPYAIFYLLYLLF